VQFGEIDKVSDLDPGSGQGHISMRNTYRTTRMLDYVTTVSSSMETWPLVICVISTFREV